MQKLSSNNHIIRKQESDIRPPAFTVPRAEPEKNRREKNPTVKGRHKWGLAEWLVTGAIAATVFAITASLWFYFRPFTSQDVMIAAERLTSLVSGYISEEIRELKEQRSRRLAALAEERASSRERALEGTLSSDANEDGNPDVISSLNRTTDLGQASAFNAEPVFLPQEDSIFMFMLDTSLGPMLYYSQGDVRWKDYLYGGQDPISRYGCGPVCVAMVINSFSSTSVSPDRKSVV